MLLLALSLTIAAPHVDTKDFAASAKGLAKIVWDDHWLEADGDAIWLYQRFSYDGDTRFYDRATSGTFIVDRKAEQGERQVDDCRRVGPFERCRHAELVRLPLTKPELQAISQSSGPITFEFYGSTRKPYKVKLDPAEAALLLHKINA